MVNPAKCDHNNKQRRHSDGGTVVLDGPEKTLTFQLKPRGMDDNQE